MENILINKVQSLFSGLSFEQKESTSLILTLLSFKMF